MHVALAFTNERGASARRLVTAAEAARGVRAPRGALVAVSARLVLSWACAAPLPACPAGSTVHARFGPYTVAAFARARRVYVSVLAHAAPSRPLASELLRSPALRARARAAVALLARRAALPPWVWPRVLLALLEPDRGAERRLPEAPAARALQRPRARLAED
jgi:hypothetical protein